MVQLKLTITFSPFQRLLFPLRERQEAPEGDPEGLGAEGVPLRQLLHGHAHPLRRPNVRRMGRVSLASPFCP